MPAAERIVPHSLEVGGKTPSIVYPDADEDWVVAGGKLTARTQALKLGDPA